MQLKKLNVDSTVPKIPLRLQELSKLNVEKSLPDVSKGLSLHFDWLEGMKQQIQEVQGRLKYFLRFSLVTFYGL